MFRDLISEAAASSLRRFGALASRKPAAAVQADRASEGSFWALDGITFEIPIGEVVGVIGRNGAGKSTLLKILSRITEPTEGYAEVRGRVGSLLEVGTGFHPELTGRENVYLNGAILGMRKAEIRKKMDEIVGFAGVERFIDTPVKFYSSGMYLRLAFAVAAHLESEILLVDEALAVGDAEFQKKCLTKMHDVAQQGRTVMFVSHNLLAIQDLCDQAIWIDQGRIVERGPSGRVVDHYLHRTLTPTPERRWCDIESAPGTERVRLHSASIRSHDSSDGGVLTVRSSFTVEYSYWILEPTPSVYASIYVYNEQGVLLFNSGPPGQPGWREQPAQPGLYREACSIPGDLLNNGLHRVEIEVIDREEIYRHEDLLVIEIQDAVGVRDHWYGAWPGVVRPILNWEGEHIGPLAAARSGDILNSE